MTEPKIRDFHVHFYFNADEVDHAKAVVDRLTQSFDLPVGHFHAGPVGPHPRGSVQVTVQPGEFGEVAQWLALGRDGLTVFAHASTGDDRSDHTDHVIWFGPSEALDLSLFS